MKKLICLIILLVFSTSVLFAQQLTYKFANPRIMHYVTVPGYDNFEFDIQIKASAAGTYLWQSQISLNFDNTTFSPTITTYWGVAIAAPFNANNSADVPKYAVKTKTLPGTTTKTLFLVIGGDNNVLPLGLDGGLGGGPTDDWVEITTSYQTICTVKARIIGANTSVTGIDFNESVMNGQGQFVTGPNTVAPYANPHAFDPVDFLMTYVGRLYSALGWSQMNKTSVGQWVNWTTPVNTSVWEGTAATPTSGTSLASDLRIHSGAGLTIPTTGQLTVTSLENNATNGIIIQSDATSTGSMKIDGPITGTGTANVQRYISGYSSYAPEFHAIHGWHLLSSPVSTFNIASSAFVPGATDDLYRWNEPADQWFNYKNGDPTQMVPGSGYLVAYSAGATKTFAGSLNSASTDLTVTGLTNTTSVSIHKGFNLLGNPFSSALVWNKTGGSWSLSNVDANCQVWDEVNASYKVILPDEIIPAMNGFMVYTTGGGTLTIPKASQVHSYQAWYKNDQQENDCIVLVARDPEGKTAQESIIRFNTNATEGYDNEYDSYFLRGFAPQFYSVAGNEFYALNTLPEITDNLAIPFTFVKNRSGTFSIELAKTLPDAVLYLQDNKTNTIQNLSENPVYNFSAEEGDQPDRFVLRFGAEFLRINPADTKAGFYIWYNQGNINFSSMPENVLSMSIIDMAGREIVHFGKPGADKVSVGKKLAPGYYIARINMTDKVVAMKIFIN